MDPSATENVTSKQFLTQNIPEIWDLRIIGLEGEEIHLKGQENISNKIIEEKFPNLKEDTLMKVQQVWDWTYGSAIERTGRSP